MVTGTCAAIESIVAGRFEILNIGGTRTTSLRDLVSIIERVVGKQAVIEWAPDQPGDVPITHANIERARARLGYQPTTTPEQGIAKYWAWANR